MSMDLEELIQEAKQVLHGLFDRPRLTDKLLSKPPFRFLHDLVSAITASTGFAEGLYNDAELEAATISDKASKIVYLEKLILLVGICSGETINVRPSRVLAGLEPENTNCLLIALGQAVRNSKLDFEEAVRITLAGGQPGTRLPLFNETPHSDIPKDTVTETKVVVVSEKVEEVHENKAGRNDEPHNSQYTNSRKSAQLTRAEGKTTTDSSSTSQHEKGFYSSLNVGKNEAKGVGGGAGDELKQQETTSPSLLFGMAQTCDGSIHMTRRMLEPIIKHPRLTDKLLGRPPFRFLHDIVGEVMKQTGFAEGLFEPYLLDSANVKDKRTKLIYLEKIFELVGTQLGVTVQAKPAKVVAGLEPENTNQFLQLLSLAAQDRSDSNTAVRHILENHGVNSNAQTVSEAGNGGGIVQRRNRLNNCTISAVAESKSDATQEANVSHYAAVETLQEKQGWDRGEEAVSHHSQPKEESKRSPAPTEALNEKLVPNFGWERELETTISRRIEGANMWNKNTKQSSSIRPKPKMARRGPPMVKNPGIKYEGKLMDVESIPKYQRSTISIMADGYENSAYSEEEKDDEAMKLAVAESKENAEDIDGGEGIRLGRLQHKIDNSSSSRWDRKCSSISTTTLRGADGELEVLRRTIEMLCQSTAPLGHSMEYVYEDLTMMSAEMEKWRKEWQFNQDKLETEKETTEVALQPLKTQLLELEEKMKEQKIKVSSVKATISHNDSKLQSLIALGCTKLEDVC